ncbi:NAD(P)-dependent oxidoreductase [Sphingomonas sabuli]|uniref:NAD(P)-dependent oxidoreductase n=1 Tax=Sphingomonas sabuli TaxID=2764186 RepID=A0A7G9L457_9SPHN|nr:NAD(P)-dependent oxidoreductase [Sphingomonas sabuli]QNM83406.1 NAD(P)-dependent oxidoreductase [Sphingomonas sabuli]
MVATGDLIAVTGGTGVVGRRLVTDLVDDGFRVRVLSRSAPDDDIEHVAVDFSDDRPLPSGALDGCAAVAHLAAHIPASQESEGAAPAAFQTNVFGLLKLLAAMEEAGVTRLIQTTSANAYAPGVSCAAEDDPMFPSARAPFYLSSKLVQDVLGAYWHRNRGIAVTTLRLSSVYGAGVETSLLTRFVRLLRDGTPIRLANGGSFAVDFVEVGDVSRAIRLFLANEETGAFNIAGGEKNSLLDVCAQLVELTGAGPEALIVERGEQAEAGFPAIDIAKAARLGFTPTPLRKGLERLVAST